MSAMRAEDLQRALEETLAKLPGSSLDMEAHDAYVYLNDYAFYIAGAVDGIVAGDLERVSELHEHPDLRSRLQQITARGDSPAGSEAAEYLRALDSFESLATMARAYARGR